jgi:hypothetical protein
MQADEILVRFLDVWINACRFQRPNCEKEREKQRMKKVITKK